MTEEVAVASSAHPSAGERCDSTIPNDTSSSSGSSTTPASLQSSSPPSPYQVLGIAAGASMPEAKAAFQRLARLHHPGRVVMLFMLIILCSLLLATLLVNSL